MSRWLRIGLPVLIIIGWLGLAGVGGPYFGKIDEVSSNDLATFLPENAESTTVKNELEKFQDSSTIPLIVVFESDEALTNTQRTQVSNVQNALQKKNSVAGDISPPIVSDDKKAEFVVVPLDSEADLAPIITDLQST
ncbi:MAG TPA: MMPL family transporter, partial [Patescibacteria group bacterium]|nr:MMPL family transporter [Patescibacteria group bacterium]